MYLQELFSNFLIFLFGIIAIVSMSFYNAGGVMITKLFGGLTRSILNVTRTIFLWGFGILITVYGDSEKYNI